MPVLLLKHVNLGVEASHPFVHSLYFTDRGELLRAAAH